MHPANHLPHGRSRPGRSSLARVIVRSSLLLPMPLLLACVGSIEHQPFGPDDPAGPTYTPPPDKPTGPQPDSAPTTGFIPSAAGPASQFMRLSHTQWENTVRDLFGLSAEPGLSKQFVNEGLRAHFDNQGGDLEVSGQLWFDYNKAAGALATQVVRDPKVLTALVPGTGDAAGRAESFIRSFGERAYRRPLTESEVQQYVALYRRAPELSTGTDAFLDGLEIVVSAFLQSPHFLYRIEVGSGVNNGRLVLTDYEVASRLSYGLVRTMPDAQLFQAARGRKLRTREDVLAHAQRLLDSPAGQATIRDLHGQMLRGTDPSELVRDVKLHPQFKPGMGVDMRREAIAFADDIIYAQKKGVTELLTASYTFATERTAPIYGATVPGGDPEKLHRIELDPAKRAGLYTQLGFLATTGTDFNSRPIKRGVKISEGVLCADVPPPPPEVNDPSAPQLEGKTNRQNFEAATEMEGTICRPCHQTYINPLGFALEHFDGLGAWRDDEKGKPIDATGTYKLGGEVKTFNGAAELMRTIAKGSQAHECYSEHLFEYIYGRTAGEIERSLLQELGRRSRLAVPIKNLILDLVATDAFLTRKP